MKGQVMMTAIDIHESIFGLASAVRFFAGLRRQHHLRL